MLSPALRYRANNGITFRPDANTVLWLPGQDDPQSATIRDRSGKGNDGTIIGATWAKTGQGLSYLDFDGADDAVTITRTDSLKFGAGDFTLESWAKPTNAADERYIISTYNAASAGWSLLLQTNGTIRAIIRDGVSTLDPPRTLDIDDGEWHHVVFTRVGSVGTLYDNVTNTTTATQALGSTDNNLDLAVGSQAVITPIKSMLGGITLTRVYKGIGLSAAVIAEHFKRERHLFGR